jgi:hypothetical protein
MGGVTIEINIWMRKEGSLMGLWVSIVQKYYGSRQAMTHC